MVINADQLFLRCQDLVCFVITVSLCIDLTVFHALTATKALQFVAGQTYKAPYWEPSIVGVVERDVVELANLNIAVLGGCRSDCPKADPTV